MGCREHSRNRYDFVAYVIHRCEIRLLLFGNVKTHDSSHLDPSFRERTPVISWLKDASRQISDEDRKICITCMGLAFDSHGRSGMRCCGLAPCPGPGRASSGRVYKASVQEGYLFTFVLQQRPLHDETYDNPFGSGKHK